MRTAIAIQSHRTGVLTSATIVRVGREAAKREAQEMGGEDRVLRSLLAVCEKIAQGNYDQVEALFEMTGARADGATEAALAEAFGNMVVQLEAREYRLNMTIDDLRETQRQVGREVRRDVRLARAATIGVDRDDLAHEPLVRSRSWRAFWRRS